MPSAIAISAPSTSSRWLDFFSTWASAGDCALIIGGEVTTFAGCTPSWVPMFGVDGGCSPGAASPGAEYTCMLWYDGTFGLLSRLLPTAPTPEFVGPNCDGEGVP